MHFVSGAPISCKSDRVTSLKALRSKRSGLQPHMAARRAGRTVWPVLPTQAPAARTAGRVRLAAPTARQNAQPGGGATRRIRPRATCVVRPQPPLSAARQVRAASSAGQRRRSRPALPNRRGEHSPLPPGEGPGVRVGRRRCVLTASAGLQSEASNQRTHSHRRPTSSTITLDHCSPQRMAPCA